MSTEVRGRSAAGTRARRPGDATGLVLVAAWAAWVAVVGGDSQSGWKLVQLVACSFMTLVLAGAVTRIVSWAIPLAVVIAAAAALVSAGPEVVTGGPLAGPLGYANANAAFFVQGSIGGWMTWQHGQRLWLRRLSAGAAVLFAGVALLAGSRTAQNRPFTHNTWTVWRQDARAAILT